MQTNVLARPEQPLSLHLANVANRAEAFAARFGAAPWGRAAGLLHDIGKASDKFQRYIREVEKNRELHRNGGDHSTAGARYAARNWGGAGRLLAYCIAGHHAGLPDGLANDEASLAVRLDPARRRIEDCSGWRDCLGPDHAPVAPDFAHCPFSITEKLLGFRMAFFVRMLFSCLVDADRLDAEAAGEDKARAERRAEYPGIAELRARLDAFLADKTADANPTPVNRIRAEVLARCRETASLPPGLFSLTVPTGGGKTLSSLAFALDHAERHDLERVVYVIPYTSIIEQNAAVFREALGDADGRFVVEHHSNLVPPEPKDDGADDRPHPATENWDAPVIVTTAVQFFESLFSARAGRCRKLHNLAQSVVILDEAQMLPLPYLTPCVEALRELTASYGASVVLCTATQPALNAPEQDGGDGLRDGLVGVREIIADPPALHEKLKRVAVRHVGPLTDAELADRLVAERQVLCIVPTRRMARGIFDALRAAAGTEAAGEVFHLSALMCPAHRSAVLERIKQALRDNRPCRVVSTTLVEAGVDLDLPVVYRAEAGIDSIAQAAGRCNREGRLECGHVYVFTPEVGLPGGALRRSAQAGQSVAERHAADLLHPDAVRDYFLELYWQTGEGDLDARDIVRRTGATAKSGDFSFREIGRDFQFIDTPTQGLIIEFNDVARDLVRRLDALETGDRAGGLLRRLQRHTVSLRLGDIQRLERAGAIRRTGPGGQFLVLANPSLYDAAYGLDLFAAAPGVQSPEDLTI
jgi:CRISPR-associated endonuclease/helicase Cas3